MKRSIRWLVGLVVLIFVMLGAALWLRHDRADETFAANVGIIEELIAAQRTRGGARPTLGAPDAEGDAWPLYERAYGHLASLSGRDREIEDWLCGTNGVTSAKPTETEREAFYAKTQPLLDDLRAASRAPTLSAGYPYERGMDVLRDHVPAWQSGTRILYAHVKHHLERDEVSQALDCAVLNAFTGEDHMRHTGFLGGLAGMAVLRMGLVEIRGILRDHAVTAERLERLAAEVEALRRDLPTLRDAWRVEEITLRQVLGDPDGVLADAGVSAGPRFFFSSRLMAADAIDQLPTIRERIAEAASAATTEAILDGLGDLTRDLRGDANVLLGDVVSVCPIVATRFGWAKVDLELMRLAVAIARYRRARGGWPARLEDLVPRYLPEIPTDPYTGDAFRYRSGKVWSIGGDGDDDGGRPLGEDDDIDDDGDVVWTLFDPDG